MMCRFLREDLELVFHNQSNISLADLNMSIGRALAATYWYGGYSPTDIPTCVNVSLPRFRKERELF